MKLTIIVITATLFCCLNGLPPDHAHAYTWTVRVPDDMPFQSCQIQMQAGGYNYSVDLNRGQSKSWTAPDNAQLSNVGGIINDTNSWLMSRTCAGTDYANASDAVRCPNNVRVKVCPKVPNPRTAPWYHFGFCPD